MYSPFVAKQRAWASLLFNSDGCKTLTVLSLLLLVMGGSIDKTFRSCKCRSVSAKDIECGV